MTTLPRPIHRALHILLLAAAGLFLGLHFVHLTADFPNFSPWDDWSKYTDEGWYGDAAIRHFQLGHWYVPGDFNPAVALPVWPFLEALVFAATGVSVVAARALTVAVFAGILIASWFLIRRDSESQSAPICASVAILLLAANPFCFAFTRLAIIEPLLVLLMLLALLATNWVSHGSPLRHGNLKTILALGLIVPALILAKTTALFLLPAIFWMLFARTGYRVRPFLRVAVPSALLAIAIWLAYFYFAVIRTGHLIDYRYLFSANAYTAIAPDNFAEVIAETLSSGTWIGDLIYPLALAAIGVALTQYRRVRSHPVIFALIVWIGGYMAFLAYHDNIQPRYYLVVAIPLTLLLPLVVQDILLPRIVSARARVIAISVLSVVTSAIVVPSARQTLHFVRHPDYTLIHAADGVSAYIAQDRKSDPTHNPLLLSVSGSEIALFTGQPAICDEFGTLDLAARVNRYQPCWFATWNEIKDDAMDALTPNFHVERVATFPAMDDPDRNLLVLYKLYPAGTQPPRPRRKRLVPRQLRTPLGQQPSVQQLQH